jgi:hypothetical protein
MPRRPEPPADAPPEVRAHARSIHHRDEILRARLCGCFHCLATYPPGDIREWCDGGDTALCPRCGIDAVLGDNAGFPLDAGFLRAMQKRWFE